VDSLIKQTKQVKWLYRKHALQFKRPAKTSRDTLYQKPTWYIKAIDASGNVGYGEVSIIEGLSLETESSIQQALELLIQASLSTLDQLPALRFAIETALSDMQTETFAHHFDSSFLSSGKGIPINGLVWMGDKDFMFEQIKQKLELGFDCIKLKVGGIDFEEELQLLKYIRKEHSQSEIELRLDANGAFTYENALERLKQLSDFSIHSIEQPIRQGQIQAMAHLCRESPIPIALDEELIAVHDPSQQEKLLAAIRPAYLILKPSLLGGWQNCDRWIEIGEAMGINYWATSALESNIGLNAIAQWIGAKSPSLWQGLGTGGLYHNNIATPLEIKEGRLYYNRALDWGREELEGTWHTS